MRSRTLFSGLAVVLSTLIACRSRTVAERSSYPEAWWREVPPEQAASWEIPPQAAGPGEVILSKRNELGILSNFAATPFDYRGVRYASVEGFWQMMKYPEGPADERSRQGVSWQHTRAQVAAMTAFEAKQAGGQAEQNMRRLGIEWVTFEGRRLNYREKTKGDFYRLIVEAEKAKLEQNPRVREVLSRTKGLRLRPDHHQSPDDPPAWRYFEIWSELRDAL